MPVAGRCAASAAAVSAGSGIATSGPSRLVCVTCASGRLSVPVFGPSSPFVGVLTVEDYELSEADVVRLRVQIQRTTRFFHILAADGQVLFQSRDLAQIRAYLIGWRDAISAATTAVR